MSTIKAIAIKNRSRVAMQSIESAQIAVASGILGDLRGAQQGRQITILSETAWQRTCAEIDADLPWTTRRANLLVDGVEFDASYVGKRIRIGEVELVVTRETNPCSLMDAQHQGLTAALTPDWRGGICCNVVSPGDIRIGDQIVFD
ncbi:MAG: MOSC domain-containing protein [Gammaproteobacteria bacterium]|nr:MOSC domain-containing protein [Gammaproteobacteria bacterium]